MRRIYKDILVLLTLLTALSWLPGTVRAQNGTLMGSADLDGNGTLETVYNNGASINVVSAGAVTSYAVSTGSWALLYGNFTSVADLDGTPGAEIPINIGGSMLVIKHRTRDRYSYSMSGSWSAVPGGIVDLDGVAGKELTLLTSTGLRIINDRNRTYRDVTIAGRYGSQFAVIGKAIADLDGVAGAEIPVASGQYLAVYNDRAQSLSGFSIGANSWAVCTEIVACVSDMEGDPGAELMIVASNTMKIFNYRMQRLNSFAINAQFATLRDGVRDFDGQPGNDIAVSTGYGDVVVVFPRARTQRLFNHTGTFGTWWELVGYANLDGVAGDEIRVRSLVTGGRTYRLYPVTGAIRVE